MCQGYLEQLSIISNIKLIYVNSVARCIVCENLREIVCSQYENRGSNLSEERLKKDTA